MDKHKAQSSGMTDASGIVTARGTGEGLVVRIDGRAKQSDITRVLREFLEERKRYLVGQEVVVEWVGASPEPSFADVVSRDILGEFDIAVRRSRLRPAMRLVQGESEAQTGSNVVSLPRSSAPDAEEQETSDGLLGGVGSIFDRDFPADSAASTMHHPASDSGLWDEADARVVYTTLRSGQRIETEHSVIVFGDVNSGAEIIAGGDIAVLGTLRGVAHAGAYDTSGGGRVIFALNLRPTQLRIGMVITRGGSDGSVGPELARVEGTTIVVEQYQARKAFQRTFQGVSGA